ncbi:hypothetical protein [Nitrosomonas communis]|uniref:hypothetical protein n=1 Tax=Nitrosomonas communis TaxID=44574 RepID=UPI003D270894
MYFAQSILFTVFFLFLSAEAYPEEISESGFVYSSGKIFLLYVNDSDSEFVATWNPKGSDKNGQFFKPGLKISFWGKATACSPTMTSGPVTSESDWLFSQAEAKTGLPLDWGHPYLRWAPTGGGNLCIKGSEKLAGPSFVHINEDMDGGIGIFSSSGRILDNEANKEFLQPFDDHGQFSTGANRDIQGTFITFRFATNGANAIFPFGKGESSTNGKAVVINSTQSLATYKLAPPANNDTGSPNQVKQQFSATFLNVDCIVKQASSPCQLNYLLHTAIIRQGVTNWSNELWFDKATLLLDPAQGHIPVIHGPIKANGIDTLFEDAPELSAWRSLDSNTLHASFSPTQFAVEISYEQFLSALKVAAKKISRSFNFSEDEEALVRTFGNSWYMPKSWRLLDISVGQEVHNVNAGAASWIGGSVTEISIRRRE